MTNNLLNLKPKLSRSKSSIYVNIDNIKVAQVEYKEGPVGLTYIDFGKKGAKCYMDVRGGWPAYINALSTNHKQHIDGINISGGSILGLESTTGIITESLRNSKYKFWKSVNGSIIYSHNLIRNKIYPDKNLGSFVFNNLDTKLYNGQSGAGLSAAKGQGWEVKNYKNGIKILALVVNNAIGDIYKNNKKINSDNIDFSKLKLGTKTTITVLITNLQLDNDELKQMAHQVNSSMAKIIRPFNTFYDGDVFYSCSTETKKNQKNLEVVN